MDLSNGETYLLTNCGESLSLSAVLENELG